MIIIKYHEWLRFEPDYREIVYELCNDDFEKVKKISKEKAIELIKDNGLQKVHHNRYGSIWK